MFGGHHLGLNATFANGDVTLAPSLTGSQPAFFTQNDVEVQVFRAENDAAFALINLLDASQQQKAIISPDFIDLLLGPGEDGKSQDRLPPRQQRALEAQPAEPGGSRRLHGPSLQAGRDPE